jgi:hypothetical protein
MFVLADRYAWHAWRYILVALALLMVFTGPAWVMAVLTMHVTATTKAKLGAGNAG